MLWTSLQPASRSSRSAQAARSAGACPTSPSPSVATSLCDGVPLPSPLVLTTEGGHKPLQQFTPTACMEHGKVLSHAQKAPAVGNCNDQHRACSVPCELSAMQRRLQADCPLTVDDGGLRMTAALAPQGVPFGVSPPCLRCWHGHGHRQCCSGDLQRIIS